VISIKRIIGVIGFICLFLIAGCSEQTTTEKTDSSQIKPGDISSYEDTFVAEQIEENIDDDDSLESVKLLISPAPMPDPENEGHYLWGDSHVWQIVVEDDGKRYELFNDNVQGLGELFIVNEEEGKNTIAFLTKGTTLGLFLINYNKEGYFEMKESYNKGPILHRSNVK
jgi:hypothetical protein